ncbi:MAG: Na+/H+ antiporter NhaA [Alphaproteobacteria bacterium]|jgi:NhaA family Na+:H+ antiporter|nr:Na+/H+ antiporter NhaA [Candidatus Jidaibacter sp.]
MAKIKLSHLYHSELTSGILLMLSVAAAVLVANIGPWQQIYKNFVFYPVTLGYGAFIYNGPLIQIVNDALMTLFFLLIGLELKFHLVRGEFQDKQTLILPGAAAVGGIVVPVLIYLWFNINSPTTLKGWAIPIATDTAFMLGILSLFGNFISTKLRAFIIGFSLIDDAIALFILGVFYSKSASLIAILISIMLTGLLCMLNRLQVTRSCYYLFIGIFLWIAMVESGIHGTLCGIVLALTIPVVKGEHINLSFNNLENVLRPIVYFAILPLFAFINSGVSFTTFSGNLLMSPLALGIILGLFVGKQIGIFLFAYAAVKLSYCSLPDDISWPRFYAIGILGGIGFTLSLFIGDLTFEVSEPNYIMRISVIIGSLLSAIFGTGFLIFLKKRAS